MRSWMRWIDFISIQGFVMDCSRCSTRFWRLWRRSKRPSPPPQRHRTRLCLLPASTSRRRRLAKWKTLQHGLLGVETINLHSTPLTTLTKWDLPRRARKTTTTKISRVKANKSPPKFSPKHPPSSPTPHHPSYPSHLPPPTRHFDPRTPIRTAELLPIINSVWPFIMTHLGPSYSTSSTSTRTSSSSSQFTPIIDLNPTSIGSNSRAKDGAFYAKLEANFIERDPQVWIAAAKFVEASAEYVADFVGKRIVEEAWPRFEQLLTMLRWKFDARSSGRGGAHLAGSHQRSTGTSHALLNSTHPQLHQQASSKTCTPPQIVARPQSNVAMQRNIPHRPAVHPPLRLIHPRSTHSLHHNDPHNGRSSPQR